MLGEGKTSLPLALGDHAPTAGIYSGVNLNQYTILSTNMSLVPDGYFYTTLEDLKGKDKQCSDFFQDESNFL